MFHTRVTRVQPTDRHMPTRASPYPRCDAYATEFDLEAEEYVPLPKVCGNEEIWDECCKGRRVQEQECSVLALGARDVRSSQSGVYNTVNTC